MLCWACSHRFIPDWEYIGEQTVDLDTGRSEDLFIAFCPICGQAHYSDEEDLDE